MNRRAFLSLPLSALGLAALPGAAKAASVDVPRFGRFTTPPKSGRVSIDVQFMAAKDVPEVCRRLSQWPDTSKGAPACVNDRFTPGEPVLICARPESWDDLEVMIQIGHEVLHTLGAEHV